MTILVKQLIPPRAPNLPVAPAGYEQRYIDQLNNTLRLYFNTIDNFAQPLVANPGGAYLQFPSASYQDNETQATPVNVAQPMRFGKKDYNNQVTIEDQVAVVTASRATTTMTVSAVTSGVIYTGMTLVGTGWATGSVTGSIAGTTLIITAVGSGTVTVGSIITGTGITAGTRVVATGTGAGGTGTYEVNIPQTVSSTTIAVYNTTVTAFGSGTGGVGTYTVSTSGTIASATVTGRTPTKFTPAVPGTYNLQFSCQFENSTSAAEDVYIWIRVGNDGGSSADVDGSNGTVSVPAKHGSTSGGIIASWNYFVNLGADDYVELWWSRTNSGITMPYTAAGTSPTRPSTASAIATLGFVSALYT